MTSQTLHNQVDDWIVTALPLWLTTGWDSEDGGFYESLDLEGQPIKNENRRIRVQFRQLFSASYAAHFNLWDGAKQNADRSFDFIKNTLWGCDGQKGFPHILDPNNKPIDSLRDSYDHMFCLLALAWYARIEDKDDVILFIDEIISFLDTDLRAINGGWLEGQPNTLPRRQNPHMHGLEAFMALYEGTKNPKYLSRAGECFGYFAMHFYDSKTGTIREFFNEDWTPHWASHDEIEPGHMVEWVWLLHNYQALTDTPCNLIMKHLYNTALKIGVKPNSRFLVDVTDPTGEIIKKSKRCWPQTELVKSSIALYRDEPNLENKISADKAVQALFDGYLTKSIDGGWVDKLTLEEKPDVDRMPASTLYHILVALNEYRLFIPQ